MVLFFDRSVFYLLKKQKRSTVQNDYLEMQKKLVIDYIKMEIEYKTGRDILKR